jgi:hypothetical protein
MKASLGMMVGACHLGPAFFATKQKAKEGYTSGRGALVMKPCVTTL